MRGGRGGGHCEGDAERMDGWANGTNEMKMRDEYIVKAMRQK
jgi:hypothetical protein